MTTRLEGPRWTDTFMGHIVIHVLSHSPEEQQRLFWEQHKSPVPGVDVTVTIDGMPFDFKHFSDHLEKHMDDMILRKAGELMQENVGDLTNKLYDAMNELINGIRKQAADKLGYNPWEHER